MSTRHFDPARDGIAALQHGWLRPDERLDWTCPGRRVGYEVPGRKKNGKPRAHPAPRVLGWILLFPVMLILFLGELFKDPMDMDLSDDGPQRRVVAKGTHTHCTAARLADARAKQSFWVLTDRRFAFLTADPATGRLHTVWELPAEQYVYIAQPGTWLQLAHERIKFADQSTLTFLGKRRH